MDAKMNDNIVRVVEKEIDTIVGKPEMSSADLECLGELVDILKDIHEINSSVPMGMSAGVMPYWGAVNYDDSQWKRDRNSYGTNNGPYRYNDGNSYGRGYDMRMPNRSEW